MKPGVGARSPDVEVEIAAPSGVGSSMRTSRLLSRMDVTGPSASTVQPSPAKSILWLHTAASWLPLIVRNALPRMRDRAKVEFTTSGLRLIKIAPASLKAQAPCASRSVPWPALDRDAGPCASLERVPNKSAFMNKAARPLLERLKPERSRGLRSPRVDKRLRQQPDNVAHLADLDPLCRHLEKSRTLKAVTSPHGRKMSRNAGPDRF